MRWMTFFLAITLVSAELFADDESRLTAVQKKHEQAEEDANVAYWKAKLAADRQYDLALQAMMRNGLPMGHTADQVTVDEKQTADRIAEDQRNLERKISPIDAAKEQIEKEKQDADPMTVAIKDGKLLRGMTVDQVEQTLHSIAVAEKCDWQKSRERTNADGESIVQYTIVASVVVNPNAPEGVSAVGGGQVHSVITVTFNHGKVIDFTQEK